MNNPRNKNPESTWSHEPNRLKHNGFKFVGEKPKTILSNTDSEQYSLKLEIPKKPEVLFPDLTTEEFKFLFLVCKYNHNKNFRFRTALPRNETGPFPDLKRTEILQTLVSKGYLIQGGEGNEDKLTITDKAAEVINSMQNEDSN